MASKSYAENMGMSLNIENLLGNCGYNRSPVPGHGSSLPPYNSNTAAAAAVRVLLMPFMWFLF